MVFFLEKLKKDLRRGFSPLMIKGDLLFLKGTSSANRFEDK